MGGFDLVRLLKGISKLNRSCLFQSVVSKFKFKKLARKELTTNKVCTGSGPYGPLPVQTLFSSYKLCFPRTNFIFLAQTLFSSYKLYFPRANFIFLAQTLLSSYKLYFLAQTLFSSHKLYVLAQTL